MARRGASAGDSSADVPGLAPRREAARLVASVLRDKRALDECLDESGALARMEERDRGLVRAIVATTLRRRGQIEHAIAPFLKSELPRKSGVAREILLTGAAQLLFMRVPAHAAIDLAVRAARAELQAQHFASLVNALLRRVANLSPVSSETAWRNVPEWMWSRWVKAYDAETAAQIVTAHLGEPPLDLTVKEGNAAALAERLGGILLPTGTVRLADPQRVEALPGFGEGAWWVQDAAAALPAKLLGDVGCLRVLDLCAAPGGKTAQLAASGANVTAVDRSGARLERLKENLERLALDAEVVEADALTFTSGAPYDAVLLDAPCSATGTIRRHPDVPWLKTLKQVEELAALQSKMLDHAATLVRRGGLLLYCTCSLEPEEGEEQASAFLGRNASFERIGIEPREVGGAAQLLTQAGDLRTLPCHALGEGDGIDGFYVVRLRRAT